MNTILFHRTNLFMAASHSFPNGDGQSLEQLLVKLVLDYVRAENKNALPERTADKESEGAYEGSMITGLIFLLCNLRGNISA